jgi:hypothetical protein
VLVPTPRTQAPNYWINTSGDRDWWLAKKRLTTRVLGVVPALGILVAPSRETPCGTGIVVAPCSSSTGGGINWWLVLWLVFDIVLRWSMLTYLSFMKCNWGRTTLHDSRGFEMEIVFDVWVNGGEAARQVDITRRAMVPISISRGPASTSNTSLQPR